MTTITKSAACGCLIEILARYDQDWCMASRIDSVSIVEACDTHRPEPAPEDEYPMAKPKRVWTATGKATMLSADLAEDSPASASIRILATKVAEWEKQNPLRTIPELAADDLAASVAGFEPETGYE